jgi:hypothetical protein
VGGDGLVLPVGVTLAGKIVKVGSRAVGVGSLTFVGKKTIVCLTYRGGESGVVHETRVGVLDTVIRAQE